MRGRVRITAGAYKGKPIRVPDDKSIRPTSNRARQALFNRLEHSFKDYGFHLRGARVADLFAGTGALGLEALSRGAAHIVFVETSLASRRLLHDNIAALDVSDKTAVLTLDATSLPTASQAYDLVLLDPPYGEGLAQNTVDALAAKEWLSDKSLIVTETAKDETPTAPGGWAVEDTRAYGRGAITYLVRSGPSNLPHTYDALLTDVANRISD